MKSDSVTMISYFDGEYRFLSNFYLGEIKVFGSTYASAEHAYQAIKATSEEDHNFVAAAETPGIAKRRGRQIKIRHDWEKVKIHLMRQIVEAKFEQHPDLMKKLKATKGQVLIEGNTWGDTFWGECPVGNGRNELGKILMAIRDNIFELG